MSATSYPAAKATPAPIAAILESRLFFLFARILLTLPFWLSGLVKLLDFNGAVAEMAHFGLNPPVLFAIATIITQLGGAALVIHGRAAWLGAGAMAIFTLLTIPIAHHFWTMEGEIAMLEMFFVIEHLGMIGGMMLAAICCHRRA
jgi:transmembrane protein